MKEIICLDSSDGSMTMGMCLIAWNCTLKVVKQKILCVFYRNQGFPCDSAGKESACDVGDLGWEDPLKKGKATHSNTLAWRIPWTVQSIGHKESDTTE